MALKFTGTDPCWIPYKQAPPNHGVTEATAVLLSWQFFCSSCRSCCSLYSVVCLCLWLWLFMEMVEAMPVTNSLCGSFLWILGRSGNPKVLSFARSSVFTQVEATRRLDSSVT